MAASTLRPAQAPHAPVAQRPADLKDPTYQAFWLLRIGFVVAPILFGLDKFAHVLVDWDKYLAPEFTDLFNAQAHTLMYAVGRDRDHRRPRGRVPSPLRGLPRRRVAGGDHHQSAADRRLLRHSPARLRAPARRPDPRPPRHRLPRWPACSSEHVTAMITASVLSGGRSLDGVRMDGLPRNVGQAA